MGGTWLAIVKKTLHTLSFLKTYQEKNDVFDKFREQLEKYSITIFKIEDFNQYFITSDSPGFSFDNENKFHPLKFVEDQFHTIPLSSKYAIRFNHPNKKEKKITIEKAELNEIIFINLGTTSTRLSNIYCEDKDYLMRITDNKKKLNLTQV